MIRSLAGSLLVWCVVVPCASAQDVDAARRAYLAGQYEEAAKRYEALAVRRPATAAPARGLARALADVGRYDEAFAAIERFQKAAPASASAELSRTLGELLTMVGRTAAAESAFTRAVSGGASDSLSARLGLALVRWDRGDTVAARQVLDRLLDAYNAGRATSAEDLTAVGTAARVLARYQPSLARDALRVYDEAIAADPIDPRPRVEAGFLLVERYNAPEARAAFDTVLTGNRRHPFALLGLARAARLDGTDNALAWVDKALAVNPSLVPARALRAALLLETENVSEAESEIERALAVNPSSVDALAVLGAVRFVRGDRRGLDQAAARAAAASAANASFYVALADAAARSRRYADAARFARRATEVDPTFWRGHALLGINQLRLGAIDSGRTHLETAFRGDPFDLWTKNTLDLLDAMDDYVTTSSARFRFVVHRRESALLTLYLAPLAEQAYDALAERYGYRPETPIRVEVFPNHADFSVRTVGLVGLGALGVSFGPVIAMDSPSARPGGEFNWGSTLWHELAHTFHLGMTDHRVPRWFTEGLAVYEERRARPGWGAHASPSFLEAYLAGRLRSMRELNEGFVRPAYPEQVVYSYFQASLVCELIARDWGEDALLGMLRAYRAGQSTEAAIQSVLDTSVDALGDRLDRFIEERYGVALTALRSDESEGEPTPETMARRARNPRDYRAQVGMGVLRLRTGDTTAAVEHLERAKELFPEYAGPDGPYWFLAQIHEARGARERAIAELTTLTSLDASHAAPLERLAALRQRMGDAAGAASALDGAQYVAPFDAGGHQRLAALYEQTDRLDLAVRERRAVVALAPADRAEALYDLARTYFLAGDLENARRWVLRALERAPSYEDAQELLLTIHERRQNGGKTP